MVVHVPERVVRLPLVLPPVAGEAFASWVDRFGVLLEVPSGFVLQRLGLDLVDPAATALSSYGVALSEAEFGQLERRSGLDRSRFSDSLLNRFEGVLYDVDDAPPVGRGRHSKVWHHWVLARGSRACRQCLTADGVWPLSWKLGFSAVCVHHRVWLTDRCGVCGIAHRLRADNREPVPRNRMVSPVGCRNLVGGKAWCPGLVTDGDDVAAPADVVAAQKHLELVTWAGEGRVIDEAVTARKWFGSFVALTTAVRFGLSAEQIDDGLMDGFPAEAEFEVRGFLEVRDRGGPNMVGKSTPTYRRRPSSAVWAGIVLRAVSPILMSSTVTELQQRLAALHEQVQRRRRHLGRRPNLPPDLERVFLFCMF